MFDMLTLKFLFNYFICMYILLTHKHVHHMFVLGTHGSQKEGIRPSGNGIKFVLNCHVNGENGIWVTNWNSK